MNEEEKTDISYVGGASFVVKGDRVIKIDPTSAVEKGEIALHSTRQKRGKLIVNGPGEYEIGGVLIATIEIGERGAGTLVHAIEMGGLTVAHVARAGGRLSEEQLS